MKKIFTTIFSLAALAACSTSETEEIQPEFPQQDTTITEYVEIGVSADTDNDTKATYDKDLHAYWEAGDQIKIIQGSATSDVANNVSTDATKYCGPYEFSTNDSSNKSATFNGSMTYSDTANQRYFHIAYPAALVGMQTTTYLPRKQLFGGTDGEFSTTTTCTYTIPSEQDGIWTPFLCGSTGSAISYTELSSQNVSLGTSRNACLAIRVFEHNGTTAKQATSITVVADNNIVGTFTATTDNNGSFSGKEFAYNGTGTTINAINLEEVAKLGDYYEYRLEVAPVTVGTLTITINDTEGGQIVRTANNVTFKANTRKGFNVAWDEADITMDANSWWEDAAANGDSALDINKLYANVTIKGVGTSEIAEKGIILNGTKYPDTATATAFSKTFDITVNDTYAICNVQPYVILDDSTEITGAEQEIVVTDAKWLPAINTSSSYIKSSYNNNGVVEKTNSLDGKTIYAKAVLVDNNGNTLTARQRELITGVTLNYGALSVSGNTGDTEFTVNPSVGQYVCTIVATTRTKVAGSLTLTSPTYTINVTGIPYYWITSTTKVECNKSTTISDSCNTYAPTTIDAKIYYNITMCGKTISHTGTLTVNGTQIFSQASTYNKDINYNNATSPNTMKLSNQTSIDFTYTNKTNSSLGTTSTGYSNINEICIKY